MSFDPIVEAEVYKKEIEAKVQGIFTIALAKITEEAYAQTATEEAAELLIQKVWDRFQDKGGK